MTKDPGTAIEGTLHSVDGQGIVRMKSRYSTDIDDLWSALTDPQRLARWYGKVEGDLTVGGEFTAIVAASGWNGRGRVDVCDPPRKLGVTMWEQDGDEGAVVAELTTDGDTDWTMLTIERRGIALDVTWATELDGRSTSKTSLLISLAKRSPTGQPGETPDSTNSSPCTVR